MWSSRCDSSWAMRVTGMPVHIATTWAISSSSTVGWSPETWACHSARSVSTDLAGGRLGLAQRRGLLVFLVVDRRVLFLGDPLEVLLRLAQGRRRRRVAQPDARCGLVDQVDRLVRQVAVGDVADRQVRGGLDRLVGDRDLVVLLVALADAQQDVDRLLEGRLLDHDRLEAALEGGVALDVLAVLVERRRADALELAAGQRRLEDVGRVDRALGGAGTDERVQLVDEEDRVVRVAELLDDLLEPLLELAAVLGAGHERPDVEGQHPLVEQRLGDVAGDDPMGQALGDGRLADARLADEGRVVLRPSRQDLDDPLDLLLSADDGIQLSCTGGVGEVDARAGRRSGSCWRASSRASGRPTSSATGRGSPRGGPCRGSRRVTRGRRRRCPRPRGRGRAADAPCRCSCVRAGGLRRSPAR